MKKLNLIIAIIFLGLGATAQTTTTVNFDTTGFWTAGSGSLSSYQTDHIYSEGLFSATASMDALRQSSAMQDGSPGANGTFAWRLRNSGTGAWTAQIASGGVATFSVGIRRWDASPNPDYTLDYSTDGGTTWSNVATINNTTLSNSSAYTIFNGTINSANPNILVRVNRVGGERIMIDDFVWTDFTSTVPVRYSKMHVFKSDQSTVFDWQTVTEDNCKQFNILHSTDGLQFVQIGSVATKAEFGTSANKLDYRFIDKEPRIGLNYYRLEQVDIDNKTKLSEVFDIIWSAEGSIISIYPNPATNILKVDLTSSQAAQTEVNLLDIGGRVVQGVSIKTVKGLNRISLSLAELAPGVYNIEVIENNRLTSSNKILKN